MKSVGNKTFRSLKTLMYRFSFIVEIAILVVGYFFLSPDNCENSLRFCVSQTGLISDDYLIVIIPLVRKIVPPLILYWAVIFVVGLFWPLPIRKFWLWAIWTAIGVACWLVPYQLEEFSRYYDTFYASVTLVLVAGLVASWLYSKSRKGGAIALALVVFVVCGSLLYEKLASLGAFQFHSERWLRPEQILDCVFGVIDKQKDIADAPRASYGIAYGLYYFFHALLAFFGGYVVIGFVSKAAVNVMLLRFSRTPDSVFWGVSSEAITLARSLSKEKNEKCVFVVADIVHTEEGRSLLDSLSDEGFLWVLEGHGTLRMVSSKVSKLFFFTPDRSRNVEWAMRLSKYAQGEPEVYICIDDEADDSRLFQWANGDDIRKKMNVHIVRETSLAADLLLRDHPIFRAPGVDCRKLLEQSQTKMTFRLLQIGFGAQGRMMLNRIICDAQAPGAKFCAVVVDRDRSAYDIYNVRCPDVKEEYGVGFKRFDVRRKAFFDWLSHELKTEYTRIVVTTGDDELNLFVADFIERHYRERGDIARIKNLAETLFVRVRHPERYAYVTKCFTSFGSDKEVYSYQSIVNFDIDNVAKQINAHYCGEGDAQSAWREAPFFNRESSRGSAMGVKNLWRLSGGEEDVLRSPQEHRDEILKFWEKVKGNRAVLSRLADAEHLRWMAFHYVRGIRAWHPECQPEIIKQIQMDFDEILENKKKKLDEEGVKSTEIAKFEAEQKDGFAVKANQRKDYNLHAALIPSDQLFRLDIYLDIRSFGRRSNALFTLYAEELRKQWDIAVGKEKSFDEKEFLDNAKLSALNKCVFAFIDLMGKGKSLPVVTRRKILGLLASFEEDVRRVYSNVAMDMQGQLDKIRLDMLENVGKELNRQKWRYLLLNSQARKTLGDMVKFIDRTKAGGAFRTMGNFVGNDAEIVESVPKYLLSEEQLC